MAEPSIVIDLEKLKHPYCGLGQFSFHLGQAIVEEASRQQTSLAIFAGQENRQGFENVDLIEPKPWKKEMFQQFYRWALPSLRNQPKLWHATHQQSKYLPLNSRVPLLLTIHDLNYLREKTTFKTIRSHRRIQKLINRATAITTISHFVADEVRSQFNLQNKPLHVVYNGTYEASRYHPIKPDFVNTDSPFLFSIGQIVTKKNFHVLVDLLAKLPKHRLIIAGGGNTEYAEFIRKKAYDLQVNDRLIMPGFVTEEERQWLYLHCEAFVFPSLTEGFGLPPIEAMSVGKPVFLANRTSLPEVGGRAAYYWNEFSPEHLLEVYQSGMQKHQSDPDHKNRLIQHAQKFSWKNAAKQYFDLYQSIINRVPLNSHQMTEKKSAA